MKYRRSGFTMIEVLLAIALGAVVMVVSSALLLSLTQLWMQEEDLDDFQDHVNGVSRFIQKHVQEGFYMGEGRGTELKWPPDSSKLLNSPEVAFLMKAPHPLLGNIDAGLVQCYISYEKGEGLYLTYHNLFKVSKLTKEPVYRVLLSPWVSEWVFHRYNERQDRWEVEGKPKVERGKGIDQFELLELKFDKEDEALQNSFIPLEPLIEL